MKTSLFDLYKVGIGPSSSHTMGPMRAARTFLLELDARDLLASTVEVHAELYGSLALTGTGHGTDRAVMLGLLGEEAATLDPDTIDKKLEAVRLSSTLSLLGRHIIPFREAQHILFHRDQMIPPAARTQHPNGIRFTAFDVTSSPLFSATYFSIGGGFIVEDGADVNATPMMTSSPLPFSFSSAAELLEMAKRDNLRIDEVMMRNECARRRNTSNATPEAADSVRRDILHIWEVMQSCVARGLATDGILPGGLRVRRRAKRLAARLEQQQVAGKGTGDPLAPLDWVTIYAMAVNEENAAGSRVVTAPTNGAAGVIPAVAHYYRNYVTGADEAGILRYFLTSAAIGILYKENASISGAEVGCQGEVGVACSMAAGGLAAAMGGTNAQVEHAAEIGMEHNLGMTCDPIGGLVQIPCIERNAMGAVKAVHACRMAFAEEDEHKVSLDQVIRTMYETGLDMQSRYKETSLGGLALNVIEC
ncbi:MAG TPA: L-serine ammonia-lyase [Acidobacteriaceae bacterium]|nr:L-serine ammonia-lyase [Acidobacteriaceae bacterium]